MENVTFSSEELKGAGQLLQESWIFYRKRIRTILGILIIPVGFSFLSGILINLLSLSDMIYSFWFSFVLSLTFLFSSFFWLWAIPSLLCCFKDNSGFGQSYKKGLRMIIPYAWVYILLAVIIAGGIALFIIPGFLFSVWLSLSVFILIFEDKRGFDCLFRSRQLIKGNFWPILLRFLSLILIAATGLFLISLLISLLKADEQIMPAAGALLGYFTRLFLLPFFLIYGMMIYKNLKEIKSEIIYKKSSKIRKIKYLIPGALGVLIFGLWFVISFLNVFWGRDIPPVDDSDLRLSKIEVPEDENAFFMLFQATEKLDIIYEWDGIAFNEIAGGEKWDDEFARQLIEKNKEVFELFDQAMELPYFQFPEFQDPETIGIDVVMPGLAGFRNIARLNSVRANYLFIEGKEKEAFDLIVKTLKMGQMLQNTPISPIINYFSGVSVKDIGLSRLRIIIPNLTLSPETVKDYIVQLDQFKENEQGLVTSLKTEYIFFNNAKLAIDKAFSGQLSTEDLKKESRQLLDSDIELLFRMTPETRLNYFYKPNQTQQIFVEHYRKYIAYAGKDCYQIEPVEMELQTYLRDNPLKILFTENMLGKIFYQLTTVTLGNIFYRKCSDDFSIIGAQLLLAIKAFKTENGELPASLADLVPQYISEIPKDPFDGEPIRYSPEEKTLYSPRENIVFQIDF